MSDIHDTITVIVGYDGSDAARHGLARVGRLAMGEMTVVVVAVVPDVGSSALGEPLGDSTFDAPGLVEEARELLGTRERTVLETRATAGDPAVVLVDAAREVAADLVIVGRRGGDFVTRTLLGSVAQRVVQAPPAMSSLSHDVLRSACRPPVERIGALSRQLCVLPSARPGSSSSSSEQA